MIDAGIWEPVERSTWSHGMVVVPKVSPEAVEPQVRITTDLRPLNRFVIPFTYPTPEIKEIFQKLRGARCFTKLDLRKSFFHIRLADESRHLTTTVTPAGMMQYKRMPMGLKDSSAVFQYCITRTLEGLPGVIPYIDDILVYGQSKLEHDENLIRVLKALNEKNFRLNADKCEFARASVSYLGHIISSDDSIQPNSKNMEAIRNVSTPKSINDVQKFLGMVNYYHELLPHLAEISEPLRAFTRKNAKFLWNESCDHAFKRLKQMNVRGFSEGIFV